MQRHITFRHASSALVIAGVPVLATAAPQAAAAQAADHSQSARSRSRTDKSKGKHVRIEKAPDSEMELLDPTLITDEDGNQRVEISGDMRKGEHVRQIWFIDPKTLTYHAFQLGDSKRDAMKLAAFFRKYGLNVPESLIEHDLEQRRLDGLSRYQKQDAEARQRREGAALEELREESPACPNGDDSLALGVSSSSRDGEFQTVCRGFGNAWIETWEPARYVFDVAVLNRTEVSANWNFYPNLHELTTYGGGSCWSNPDTFVHTSWYTLDCYRERSYPAWDAFWLTQVGDYFNFDFLADAHSVRTQASASIGYDLYADWSVNWQYTNYGLGNFYEGFFLSYVYEWYLSEDPCVNDCHPEELEVWTCEHQESFAGAWDYELCRCVQGGSPIMLDLDGDGLSLTHPMGGVYFDLLANQQPVRTAWTQLGSRDAFLALDRNGDGRIDSGAELFGNYTDQAARFGPLERNGFHALEVFDSKSKGGNGDGWIDAKDDVFASLRLWVDVNHDGISQPAELLTAESVGLEAISLHYRLGKRVDGFGNVFKYKSRILMDSVPEGHGPDRRLAIDVYLSYIK